MAVYVDDMNLRAEVPDGAKVVHGRWSHLFADTEDELRVFAERIGLTQAWIQHSGQPHVHFDVTGHMRQRAVAAGARPVTWRQAGEFFAQRGRGALIPVDTPVTSLLLISGPRDGVSKQTVRAALAPKFAAAVMLVAGGAKGVDTYAAELWREWGGLVEEHPVTTGEWDQDPRGAGFARNTRMVERVKAAGGSVLVIDLPCTSPDCKRPQPHNTHGTSHCADIAAKAGLPVEHYRAPTAPQMKPRPGQGPHPTGADEDDTAGAQAHEQTATTFPAGSDAGAGAAGQVTAGRPQDPGHAYGAIHAAVTRLAGVCDFAESLDGQGFNATDTWLGHVLAAMPAESWTEDEALAAWDMLRKYRGQLDGFEISYDHLPRPPGAGEREAVRREAAREQARQRGKRWREQQYRKANSYVRCDGDGEKVTLAFPYDPGMVDAAKAIKGRSFDWDTKTGTYPFTSLPQVVAFAETHGIEVAPEVRALVPAAATAAEQEAARPNVYADAAGRVVIAADYNPALNEALKALNGGRSTWDPRARVHRPPVHRDPGRVLEVAAEFGLTVGDDARGVIEAEQAVQDRTQAAATAFEADPVPIPGLAEGLTLKPQQYPVVRFATEHRRVLIGDDMGWGKTLSSLAAVAADSAYPAVVVCRPSLTLNWTAEIRRFFPALNLHEASGTTPQPIPKRTDVIVIGSAALAAKPHTTKAGGKEFGWVKALAAAGPKALIIDEGQDTKERGSNRSQACEQLAKEVIDRDGLVLDLTGTAILNRPRELCQQLAILGRIGEFGGPKAFLWRYCLSEVNEWGASYNGAQNLIELHDRLVRWGIMIRRSDDTKLGLPPCREHVLRIPQAALDPAVMARYRQAEADLLGYLAGQARKAAERLGTEPTHAAVQAAVRAQAAEHLVAINTLRQLTGHAKRGYVTAWVRQQVAAGEKVMVAAHHRDEVDHYAAQFGGLKLQGGQPVADKEAAKAAFQRKPVDQAPVIAVAIGAGGVGHTLTAAAIGIQAEQPWTPGESQQMKKRLHRIGQDRPVNYYITVAAGTIDEHLREVVTTKQASLNAVLDGKADEGTADDEGSVVAEIAWWLTQQGLTGTSAAQPDRKEEGTQGKGPVAGLQRSPHLIDPHDGDTPPLAAVNDPGPAAMSTLVLASVLDDATLTRMRADAAAEASPFVDPALLRDAEKVLPLVPNNWLSRVVGHTVTSFRSLANDELTLAVRAAQADTAHLESLAAQRHTEYERADRAAAEAAATRAQGERDRWVALKAQLPVPVAVQHNWTARHLDGYEQGADHIVVLEDLHVGRYRRSAGDPLCWAPSRADQLRHVHANAGDERRIPDCKACLKHAERIVRPAIEATNSPPSPARGSAANDKGDQAAASRRLALRDAAHLYLSYRLLPVPGWAAQANGACCCPRGAECPRPGKHPRSVHVGPGKRDYSWKPLACHTHAEVEQRFADGGPYATGNLMLAIPPGMLVIDQDDDDGGPQAIATLTAQHGELPATLAHPTPHGVHRVYRTPPGWTGRAWVGKDTRNPLPPGVDLRVPGQILMAAPSQVPAEGGLAAYGPVVTTAVAELPAAYLAAWTPPQPETVRLRRAVPVPPDRADTAASYVHARVEGIAADLAKHEPGGRGTAIYTAALKTGSTLGAARTTPGAEHAAAEWTDQAAQDTLMEAAEANGYVAKHGTAAARSAIRSGLRNGLRSPRPLPDFTASQAAHQATARTHRSPDRAAAQPRQAQAAGTAVAPGADAGPGTGHGGTAHAQREPHGEAGLEDTVSAVLAAGYPASIHRRDTGWGEGFRVHPQPGGGVLIEHEAVTEDIGGVTAWDRVQHMTGRYARTLKDAGYQVTSPAPGSLTVTPQPGDRQPPADVSPGRARQATRAAVAADEAYRVRDFDRARQLIGQAAELDPSRAGLWDQHRAEITAKQLFTQATAAKAAGDHLQAEDLLEQCRQLDPRLDAQWHRHLTGTRNGQATGQPAKPATGRAAGHGQQPDRPARPKAQQRATSPGTGPHWPTSPARTRSPEATGGRAGTQPEQAGHGHQTAPGAAERGQQQPPRSGTLDQQPRQLRDQHETQPCPAVTQQQPRQVSPSTETAPCPHCGHSYIRPVGETYPCLSCQTQARLKTAGYTPDSPETQQIAEWNRTVLLRRGDRQQETPQQPEANPSEPDTPSTAQPGEAGSREREKEACG